MNYYHWTVPSPTRTVRWHDQTHNKFSTSIFCIARDRACTLVHTRTIPVRNHLCRGRDFYMENDLALDLDVVLDLDLILDLDLDTDMDMWM